MSSTLPLARTSFFAAGAPSAAANPPDLNVAFVGDWTGQLGEEHDAEQSELRKARVDS
ncbi:MAG: hypothetical protein H0U66_08605 [Gemmatimonadaceae bacterium]|nr:hypothetical protein [Gemmatimonadaceae bacterium]